MTPIPKSEEPQHFGGYEVLEHVATGGMAHVFRARNAIGKIVALKVLKEDLSKANHLNAVTRFREEARTAAALQHENIVSVFDCGESEGHLFMAMEFLEGETVADTIERGGFGGPVPLTLVLQIARALEYIHSRNIIHRDLKPGNILITRSGTAKLIDFGIAKSPDHGLHTQTGFALGTVCYMAPEQIRNKGVTGLVDVYAFGMLVYEMITGRRVVSGTSLDEMVKAVLNCPLDLQPLRDKEVPAQLVDLIRRCTAKEPSERPQSFTVICGEITDLIQAMEAPPPPAAVKRRWVAMAGLAVLILCAVVAGGTAAHVFLPYLLSKQPGLPPPLSSKGNSSREGPTSPEDPYKGMLLVPAGEFRFGEKAKTSALPAYYMDRTEVTVAAYALYCTSKGRTPPSGASENPITNITINEARGFCASVGKRLPTAMEWEKAGRGVSGFTYPWGNKQDPRRANVEVGPSTTLKPAEWAPKGGASPYGMLNMAGNVWEFVEGIAHPEPGDIGNEFLQALNPPPTAAEPWVWIYGGAYDMPLYKCKMWDPARIPARYAGDTVGFRCVKDLVH